MEEEIEEGGVVGAEVEGGDGDGVRSGVDEGGVGAAAVDD